MIICMQIIEKLVSDLKIENDALNPGSAPTSPTPGKKPSIAIPLSPKDGQSSPVEDEYDPKHWKLYLPVQKNEGLWLEAGRTIASYDLYSNPKYRKPSDEVQSTKQKLRKLILCREDEVSS